MAFTGTFGLLLLFLACGLPIFRSVHCMQLAANVLMSNTLGQCSSGRVQSLKLCLFHSTVVGWGRWVLVWSALSDCLCGLLLAISIPKVSF